MAYVYDPGKSISEGFADIGKSMGEVFANIAAQKQREFQFSQNLLQNLDNLNTEVAKNGNEKANQWVKELTEKAGKSIFKDGKLSYEALGDIRRSVNDVKQYLARYETYKQGVDQYAKIAASNEGELESPSAFMRDIIAMGQDFETIKSGDINAKLNDKYVQYTNTRFKTTQLVNGFSKFEEVTVPGKDAEGNMITAKVTIPQGVSYDTENDKFIFSDDFVQKFKASALSNPEYMVTVRKKAGVSQELLSDDQLLQAQMESVVGTASRQVTKLKDELSILSFNAKQEVLNAEYNAKKSQSNYYNTLAKRYQIEIDNMEKLQEFDPSQSITKVKINPNDSISGSPSIEVGKVILQKPFPTTINIGRKGTDPKLTSTTIYDIMVGPDDKYYVSYKLGDRNKIGEVDKNELYTILTQQYLPKFKNLNAAQQGMLIDYVFGVPSESTTPAVNSNLPPLEL